MKRVYLAGKCDPDNDWRGLYSEDECSPIYDFPTQCWLDSAFEHVAGFICTGPFPSGCDHGCAHSGGTHGGSTPHVAITCVGGSKADVQNECLKSIQNSDFVFAFIDSGDAYGTLVEIGWAVGKEVPVFICFPKKLANLEPGLREGLGSGDVRSDLAGEFWFAAEMAHQFYFNDDPIACLKNILGDRYAS